MTEYLRLINLEKNNNLEKIGHSCPKCYKDQDQISSHTAGHKVKEGNLHENLF